MRLLFDDFDDLFTLLVERGTPIPYGHYDGAWRLGQVVAAVNDRGLRVVHAPGLRAYNDETEKVSFGEGDADQLTNLWHSVEREVQVGKRRA